MKCFISPKIEVKQAGNKGRGVFAKFNIKKGEVLELSPYIEVPGKDHDSVQNTILTYYWYEVKRKVRAIGLGYASLYNHTKENNADFQVFAKSKQVKIKALKDIKKGDEVFLNYGYDVFE